MKHRTSTRVARVALGGFLAFAGTASAAAADYYGIAAGDGYMMMVDKSSIYQTGGYSRGWLITLNQDSDDEDQAPIVSMLLEVDCQQNRSRPISFTARDEAGSVITSDDEVGEWSNVEPSTTGETVRDAICSPASITENQLPSDSLTDIRAAYLQTLKK
jgi:hypothetical protein